MKVIFGVAGFLAALVLSASAFAENSETGPDFAFKHPARTQVVYQIERMKWLVDQRTQDGDFSPTQARNLKAEADGVRAEEQLFASRHGGRLTVAEQKKLNLEIGQLVRQMNT